MSLVSFMSLAEQARKVVADHGLRISAIRPRGKMFIADVELSLPHGDLNMELLVGRFTPDEYEPLRDLNAFCASVREAIQLIRPWSDDIRVAVFRDTRKPSDTNVLGNTYFLEMVVRTGNDAEAVLSMQLKDHHGNQQYINSFDRRDGQLDFFTSADHASFGDMQLALQARDQFEELHDTVVFVDFVSPNGYYFIRAFEFDLNQAFMSFLKERFAGACTIYPAGYKG